MYFVSFLSKGILGIGEMQLVLQQQKHYPTSVHNEIIRFE